MNDWATSHVLARRHVAQVLLSLRAREHSRPNLIVVLDLSRANITIVLVSSIVWLSYRDAAYITLINKAPFHTLNLDALHLVARRVGLHELFSEINMTGGRFHSICERSLSVEITLFCCALLILSISHWNRRFESIVWNILRIRVCLRYAISYGL